MDRLLELRGTSWSWTSTCHFEQTNFPEFLQAMLEDEQWRDLILIGSSGTRVTLHLALLAQHSSLVRDIWNGCTGDLTPIPGIDPKTGPGPGRHPLEDGINVPGVEDGKVYFTLEGVEDHILQQLQALLYSGQAFLDTTTDKIKFLGLLRSLGIVNLARKLVWDKDKSLTVPKPVQDVIGSTQAIQTLRVVKETTSTLDNPPPIKIKVERQEILPIISNIHSIGNFSSAIVPEEDMGSFIDGDEADIDTNLPIDVDAEDHEERNLDQSFINEDNVFYGFKESDMVLPDNSLRIAKHIQLISIQLIEDEMSMEKFSSELCEKRANEERDQATTMNAVISPKLVPEKIDNVSETFPLKPCLPPPSKPIFCRYCGKTFQREESLSVHNLIHLNLRIRRFPLKMSHPKKSLKKKMGVKHLLKKSSASCFICLLPFGNKFSLAEHLACDHFENKLFLQFWPENTPKSSKVLSTNGCDTNLVNASNEAEVGDMSENGSDFSKEQREDPEGVIDNETGSRSNISGATRSPMICPLCHQLITDRNKRLVHLALAHRKIYGLVSKSQQPELYKTKRMGSLTFKDSAIGFMQT